MHEVGWRRNKHGFLRRDEANECLLQGALSLPESKIGKEEMRWLVPCPYLDVLLSLLELHFSDLSPLSRCPPYIVISVTMRRVTKGRAPRYNCCTGCCLFATGRDFTGRCARLSVCLPIYLSVCLSIYLSVCLSIYLYVCPVYLPVRPSVRPSIYLSLSIYLSIYLSVCLSVCQSVRPSNCLYVYLSIYLSISLSSYLSVCLSIYLYVCPVYLPVRPSVLPSVYLSIYLSVCLSIYLSVSPSVCLSCLPVCPSSIHPSVRPYVRLSVCLSIYLSIQPSLHLLHSTSLHFISSHIFLSVLTWVILFM
jgi:hypothetical protein